MSASATFEHGYAVVAGVTSYRTRGLPPLPPAVLNDAVDIARALWDPAVCGYRADRVRLLVDEQATAKGILLGLEWLSERTREEDTAIFFFSGHGWKDDRGTYLAAHDASTDSPPNGMIAGNELANRLHAIRAGRLAVFLDSCFSGGAGEIKGRGLPSRGWRNGLDERTYERLGTGEGRVLLASSRPDEESTILKGERNSLFTSCLLRGLGGEASSAESGVLGIWDLFRFARDEVMRRTNGRQTPLFKVQLMDNFPIALRRARRGEFLPAPVVEISGPTNTKQRTARNKVKYHIEKNRRVDIFEK
jgi:metacaspase-1